MWKKIQIGILVPIVSAAIFSLLNLFDFYATLEKRTYDALLHIKPAITEDPSILLLDVDDTAIANVGIWPWSREVMAEGLITMREFGAAYAVFDIEYTEQSPRGINSELINDTIPKSLSYEFATLYRNVQDLFTALKNRQISLKDAEDYLKQLQIMTEQSKTQLLTSIKGIIRDNDTFLGQAARFFGNAFFTINMLPSGKENIPEELRTLAKEKLPLSNVKAEAAIPYKTSDIRPAILPILAPAAGAGFPNVEVDSDGVRRRLYLILEYEGKYFPQLAFSALYHKIGQPNITIKKDRIILEGVELPNKGKTTLQVPLAEDGTVLINWPKKTYWDSFRHLSFWNLELVRRQEQVLIRNLELMDEDHYLSYHTDPNFLELYHQAKAIREEVLQGGDRSKIDEYIALRKEFFKQAEAFVKGPAEAAILAEIDEVLTSPRYTEAQKAQIKEIRATVVGFLKTYAL
ncbi:MAG: CHASE2 domain-containing protein [Spirochaetales bacterium]